MSLTPKDMDFIEAKHVAAREIALALGVPPMLLGIPGDNTYSNYQEANRTFWRQTVLPLVNRTAKALSTWLSPPSVVRSRSAGSRRHRSLEFRARGAVGAVDKATFLTTNEKRAAVGYGPLEEGASELSRKYRPDQARVPGGQTGGGQWTSDGSAADNSELTPSDPNVIPVARKPGGLPRAVWDKTVRQFVSQYCKASINRELPGQFEDVTIGDLLDLARGGDRAARTCVKLLERGKYRK